MTNRLLASELFQYLLALAARLTAIGESELAKEVEFASRFASGSTSELYGEARMVLRRVIPVVSGKLTPAEIVKLKTIADGIDSEFERIGGG